ncbi:MAG: VOC family protein [Woeseiaceae bacterium]
MYIPGAHCIYVEDVDNFLQKAVECGADKLFNAADMPYGDRQADVSDPFGNFRWISRRLIEEDYAD